MLSWVLRVVVCLLRVDSFFSFDISLSVGSLLSDDC